MHAANTKARQAYSVSSIFVQGAKFLQMCFAPLDFMICKKIMSNCPERRQWEVWGSFMFDCRPVITLNPGPPDPGTPPYNGEKICQAMTGSD